MEDKISIDDAIVERGGFGLLQWLSSTFLIMSYTSGNYIMYNMGFFEKMPDFVCAHSESP